MRVFLEILRFELRQQLHSPFLLAALALFFLMHFLAITSTGLTLWAHPRADINSIYGVSVVETTLSLLGMLPVVVFVANAVLRDHETATAELFFVKPIQKWQYLWGRFGAACILAALLGLAGVLGSLVGTLMPWLDPQRIAPFSLHPFLFCFFAIILPNILVLCALFFSVACLTRSLTATVGLALIFMAVDLLLATSALNGTATSALVLADHSGALVVDAASRNLTVNELNTLYPKAWLLENRLLWLAMASIVLTLSFLYFRFDVGAAGLNRWLRRKQKQPGESIPARTALPRPAIERSAAAPTYTPSSQLRSQLRTDVAYLLRSPLFLLILLLGAVSVINDFAAHVGPVMNTPLAPATSTMLGFFRIGLIQYILIIAIFYSGALLHRERESGIAEIVGASPTPDWVLPLSKTLALCAIVGVLLLAIMLISIGLQAANGQTNFELGLYLRTVFVYNGFYYGMLCVLAMFIQIVVQNKWLGMLLILAVNAVLLGLEPAGFEHLLYRFAIPSLTYSDMNGYGHLSHQIHALIVYWSCFCALLVICCLLLYPRGVQEPFKERLRIAKSRLRAPVAAVLAVFVVGFIASGGWIFYNTNILNAYVTGEDVQRAQADYERTYGQYENKPTPSYGYIDMAVDIFPRERRVDSRGSATLINHKSAALTEFVISLDPRLKVNEVGVKSARLVTSDAAQGFYLFKPDTPLQPGATLTLKWNVSRINRGFANSRPDIEVLENGTFVSSESLMPLPGFDDTRKLEDDPTRRKFGLPPAPRLPALGDPAFLDKLWYGIDSRADFRVVVGTSGEQIAVASGELKREWRANGRRYAEYVSERMTWPRLYFLSARYEVARDRWSDGRQNVELEVYYDAKHARNVSAMLATTKRSLDYFTREFGPYPCSSFRIMEYSGYRLAARAFPCGVAYSEATGWITDLRAWDNLDYTTIHELAHMWWGGEAYGAKMQGRQMLNETLAQYSMLMVFKQYDAQHEGYTFVNRIIGDLQRGYLLNRSKDPGLERPVIYTEDQGNISYNKGPLALYVLQETIGEAAVNQALRNYLARFAFKPAPFPTSRDLLNELRAVAGPEHQQLITDLFERILLYDIQLQKASVAAVEDGYEVTLTVSAQQFEADGAGVETQVPLDARFDVGLFADAQTAPDKQVPTYLKKHRLVSGENVITLKVARKPAYVSVDPFHKMADRWPDDNGRAPEEK